MPSEERIVTLHPVEGKNGVSISLQKYDLMREAIIDTLDQRGQLTFQELRSAVDKRLTGRFEGSIGWYFTTIKLDLEAREIVVRQGSGSPQRLQLSEQFKAGQIVV
jgi:hypothetical protein